VLTRLWELLNCVSIVIRLWNGRLGEGAVESRWNRFSFAPQHWDQVWAPLSFQFIETGSEPHPSSNSIETVSEPQSAFNSLRPGLSPSQPLMQLRPGLSPSQPLIQLRPSLSPSQPPIQLRPDLNPSQSPIQLVPETLNFGAKRMKLTTQHRSSAKVKNNSSRLLCFMALRQTSTGDAVGTVRFSCWFALFAVIAPVTCSVNGFDCWISNSILNLECTHETCKHEVARPLCRHPEKTSHLHFVASSVTTKERHTLSLPYE
jgi:hypothetical protein